MSTRNPYQPPQSNVVDGAGKKSIGVVGAAIVALCAFQLIWSAPNAFSGFEMMNTGEISPVVYIWVLLAFFAIAGGALLLVLGNRAARYAAAVSVLPAVILALGFRTNMFLAQALVSVCLFVFTIMNFRVKNS